MASSGGSGTQNNATQTTTPKETFKDVVNGLTLEDLNAARMKVLSCHQITATSTPTQSDYTEKPRAKDLSAFMAYSASLAFFAYTKPHDIAPRWQLGLTENLTNGATVQHIHKDALKTLISQVVKFQVKKFSMKFDTSVGSNVSSAAGDPYLIFKQGTSMVKWNILEDTSQTKEAPYHYLFVRENNNAKIKGFIGTKDPTKLVAGQNEPLSAFYLEVKSGKPSPQKELDVAKLSSTAVNKSLTRSFGGKTITVEVSCELIPVADFVDPTKKYYNCKLLDSYEVDYFGNLGSNWDLSLNMIGYNTKTITPIAYIDLDSSATQAWLYWHQNGPNATDNVLVLAFPGTDVVDDLQEDVATSNDTATETLGDIDTSPSHTELLVDKTKNKWKVHKGYKEAYLSIRETLLDIVYSITNWSKDWLIIVTGHSLGGSLAGIAAYDMANLKKQNAASNTPRPKLAMFTFAAPAIGNEDMANDFSTVVPFGFRVVAGNDQVARAMRSPLHRVGKVIPCDGRPIASIQDLVDAKAEDTESNTNSHAPGNLPTTALKPAAISWAALVQQIAPELRQLHLLKNYFAEIQKFLSVFYS